MEEITYDVFIEEGIYDDDNSPKSRIIHQEWDLNEEDFWNLFDTYDKRYSGQLSRHIETTEEDWKTWAEEPDGYIHFNVIESDW
jgi:hypothetical protein